MKAKDIHKLDNDALVIEIKTTRRKLFDLRTQSVTEKIEDTSQFQKIRADIARLLTEQRTREMASES